jgi:hypothetical protein
MRDLIQQLNAILSGDVEPPTYGDSFAAVVPMPMKKVFDDDEVAELEGEEIEPENAVDSLVDPDGMDDDEGEDFGERMTLFSYPVLGVAGDMFAMGTGSAVEWIDAKLAQLSEQLANPAFLRETQRVTPDGIEFVMWITGDMDREGAKLLPDAFGWNAVKRRYEARAKVRTGESDVAVSSIRRFAAEALEQINGGERTGLGYRAGATRRSVGTAQAAGEAVANVESVLGEMRGKFAPYGIELAVEHTVDGKHLFVVSGDVNNLLVISPVLSFYGATTDPVGRMVKTGLTGVDATMVSRLLSELEVSGVALLGKSTQGRRKRAVSVAEWTAASNEVANMPVLRVRSRYERLIIDQPQVNGVEWSQWVASLDPVDQIILSRGAV